MKHTNSLEKEDVITSEKKDDLEPQEVEGYSRCTTHKQSCLTDCLGGGPLITDLN